MDIPQNDKDRDSGISGMKLAYTLSVFSAILMAVVSIAGFAFSTAVYPREDLIRSFVPNDLVNLVIGLPVLLVSMALARRGKLAGLLCWPGALFFVLYNYLIYTLAMPFNGIYLVYLALDGLSLWATIVLIYRIMDSNLQQKLAGFVPVKFPAIVLIGLGLVYFFRAISLIIPALSNGAGHISPDLATSISDLLVMPFWATSGILLWLKKPFGYASGLGLLYQGSMLFIALLVYFVLQPFLTAAPFALSDFIVILIMGLVCFIRLVYFLGARFERINNS